MIKRLHNLRIIISIFFSINLDKQVIYTNLASLLLSEN